MDVDTCLTLFSLSGSLEREGELLIDKVKTLDRRIEKAFQSSIYKNLKSVFAVDIACHLLNIPIDRAKHSNIFTSDYKKTLNIIKTGLNVSWQTVSLDILAVRYNAKFSNELRYVLTKYNDSLPVKVSDIINDSSYLIACAIALIQVKKEFPIAKERDALFNLSDFSRQHLSSMVTTFCKYIPSIPPFDPSASTTSTVTEKDPDPDMSSASFLSSYLRKTAEPSRGQATVMSNASSPPVVAVASAYRPTKVTVGSIHNRPTSSSTTTKDAVPVSKSTDPPVSSVVSSSAPVAAAPSMAPENRHLKALGIDLQGELRKIAEIDRRVQESAARKRKAYEVWRDAILISAAATAVAADAQRANNGGDNSAVVAEGLLVSTVA